MTRMHDKKEFIMAYPSCAIEQYNYLFFSVHVFTSLAGFFPYQNALFLGCYYLMPL